MNSRIQTYAIRITACAVLATSPQLFANEEPNVSCSPPIIVTFDAPDAGKDPGTALCYNGCPGTEPYNSNIWGAVTGYYVDANDLYHGFLRSPEGTITEFDAPGGGTTPGSGQGTVAYSINSQGDIAGQYQDDSNVFHGYVRFPDGSFVTFEAPDAGTAAFQGTQAFGINAVGEVAGFYFDASNVYHAFVRARHGAITEYDVPSAGTGAFQGTFIAGPAGSILNALGAVNGYYIDAGNVLHGYVRAPDGVIQTFDASGAGTGANQGTYGGGINLEGVIAASYVDSTSTFHAYIRASDGRFTTFEAPGAGSEPGQYFGTVATGNNDFGWIAGYSVDDNNVGHGFARAPSGKIKDFDVKRAGKGNGQGTTVWAINLWGEIAGVYTDENNVNHGFVRDPSRCQ